MAGRVSLLNREEFPGGMEFRVRNGLAGGRRSPHRRTHRGLPATACFSELESKKINRLLLIFFGVARVRARDLARKTPVFRPRGASAPLTAGAKPR